MFMLINPLFFKASYWFHSSSVPMQPTVVQVLLTFFILLFLLSVIIRIVARRRRKEVDRYLTRTFRYFSSFCFVMSLFGFFLVFFTYEEVPFLGARFWYLLWLFIALVWLFFLWRYFFRIVPQKRSRSFEHKQKEKYLPKPGQGRH